MTDSCDCDSPDVNGCDRQYIYIYIYIYCIKSWHCSKRVRTPVITFSSGLIPLVWNPLSPQLRVKKYHYWPSKKMCGHWINHKIWYAKKQITETKPEHIFVGLRFYSRYSRDLTDRSNKVELILTYEKIFQRKMTKAFRRNLRSFNNFSN